MPRQRSNPPVLKRFGQHFLHDKSVLEGIARAVAPAADDAIVEIGPGRGALTDYLADYPNRLTAIEVDRALASALRERYAQKPNVTIVESDVLAIELASLVQAPFVVVGNVPYYITTPILFHVLRPPYPRHAVFLVQREVAERIISPPGSKAYGALSANVQAVASAEILLHVPSGAFRPPPRVDSAVLRITPRSDPLVRLDEVDRFRSFVQALFGMRRKQIANSLRSAASLSAEAVASLLAGAGIDPASRVESLSPGELVTVMRAAAESAAT
jgi:16S rRNA (adenine1518-N6/adenine1519-N6)-dimethyltransferase